MHDTEISCYVTENDNKVVIVRYSLSDLQFTLLSITC